MKKKLFLVVVITIIISALFVSSTVIAQGENPGDVVNVSIQSDLITWMPSINDLKGMTLVIAGSGGYYFQKQYDGNAQPSASSINFRDGAYNYEIVLWPNISQNSNENELLRGLNSANQSLMRQSGTFTVLDGSFITSIEERSQITPRDVVNADDVIVQGSLCVGFDCIDNEDFGFDTIRLKENNSRIAFDDTSVGLFPANDWAIVANDSASGGANFLAFQDVTAGAIFPFKVTAGAPNDSLFVSNTGNIGVGTSAPILDVQVTTNNTPGLRLEQNGSGGYTPQTWDIAGNEANFFVRDITGGSRLPFRIRPGAPTSSIDVAASGNVGIGTASPIWDLDVVNTGAQANLAVRRTDGVSFKIGAGLTSGNIGTTNNFPFSFMVNGITKMTLATDGTLTVLGPVNATTFNPTSDKYAKENFSEIDEKTVLERLSTIPITTWNFIENDNKTKHMGPMAQDFYQAFGLGADDKHISTVDADGVAFAAIQELNNQNKVLTARISALEAGSTPSSQNTLVVLLAGMNLSLIILLIWSIRRGSYTRSNLGNQ